jgi:menaquinone-dependent protoporphyrinogen oxidase
MAAPILVGYATRSGSTTEVAEAVAATLRDQGLDVDLQPIKEVRSLSDYRAVVLGAPLFMFRWHKDARHFLSRYRQALEGRPAAVFALGPFHDDEKERREVRAQLDKELAKFPWFQPRSIEVFGGRFDPKLLTFPWKLLPGLGKMPPSDIRDWSKIRSWASELAEMLQN